MVDSHGHLTMPGGAHWVDRGAEYPYVSAAGTLLSHQDYQARGQISAQAQDGDGLVVIVQRQLDDARSGREIASLSTNTRPSQ